jgi:hypothetical protein
MWPKGVWDLFVKVLVVVTVVVVVSKEKSVDLELAIVTEPCEGSNPGSIRRPLLLLL